MNIPTYGRLITSTVVGVMMLAGFIGVANAQQFPSEENGIHLVGNGEVAAELSTANGQERISGRISFHLVGTDKSLDEGEVLIRGFNILFTGVPQKLIAGELPVQDPLGVLGFATVANEIQSFKYDARNRQIVGEVVMYADASFLNAFATPVNEEDSHLFETPVLPAVASVQIDLEEGLEESGREVRQVNARLGFDLFTEATQIPEGEISEFKLGVREQPLIPIDVGPIFWFEVAQRLCVQPVRVFRIVPGFPPFGFPFFQFSGAGFAFGQPKADSEWAKVDVVFTYRDMKTVFGSDFWTFDISESAALRGTVEDDDCIEIFFVNGFSPPDLWGGGATYGSGTASSQIISSDGNAFGGVDFTHLAHELGHVLGLGHPGTFPGVSTMPASTGTLMCPSGYLNDNPMVNSQENKTLLSNALLQFALKPISPGPDCLDSADCGPCP